MKPTATKAFKGIMDCIQYSQRPMELVRNATHHNYKHTATTIRQSDSFSKESSKVSPPRSYYLGDMRSSIYSEERNILIPKQTKPQNPEVLLSEFRHLNHVVRKNKSSDLRYRFNHLPRFTYES